MCLFTIRKEYIQQLITSVLFSMKKLYANFYMSIKTGELPFARPISLLIFASLSAKLVILNVIYVLSTKVKN